MKSNPSAFVLAVEILVIVLFHAVKIRQAEVRPSETAFIRAATHLPLVRKVVENKSGIEYMLVNLVK